MNAENGAAIHHHYRAGKIAFEHGHYRQSVQDLEEAHRLSNPASRLGGEIQIWLVTAYEALGERQAALALCRQLHQHPDLDTRKQSRRLRYILEAPRLVTRPEWLTQIPDLTNLEDSQGTRPIVTARPARRRQPEETPGFHLEAEPLGLDQVQDRSFMVMTVVMALLVLIGLFWFRAS